MDAEQSKTNKAEIYASFLLGGAEFAIEVSKIREVLKPPEQYTKTPLAPPYLKGIFTSLHGVIPVLDLRSILKLEESEQSNLTKVAIIEYGKFYIGVIFDKTGCVFKAEEAELHNYDTSYDAQSNHLVKGVYKKNEDAPIIQLIDIDTLFKLKNIPLEMHDEDSKQNKNHLAHRGKRCQCISFVTGASRCALLIEAIYEIVKTDVINKALITLKHSIGVIDLRGITVPVIDFSSFLELNSEQDSKPDISGKRIIVMKLNSELIGLVVDNIESIVTFYSDELIKFPQMIGKRSAMISGCILGQNQEEILLLDHNYILDSAEANEITQGHNQIYSITEDHRNNSVSETNTKVGNKKTYVAFTIEIPFVVEINQLSRIINFSEQLIYPPDLPSYFKGVYNLRGTLIPIVNTRALYNLPDKLAENSKIIILHTNDVQYGLVVDSVDSIISFNDSQKLVIPNFNFAQESNKLNADLSEIIEVVVEDKTMNLLIIDPSSVYKRISQFNSTH